MPSRTWSTQNNLSGFLVCSLSHDVISTLFKIVFATQFTKETNENFNRVLFNAENLNENDVEYCTALLNIINEHLEELTQILDARSRLFPESRLFPADRSVLLIALAEILYSDDVPYAVSVNEAANIASKYSSEKSASFVSGILSEIIKEKGNVQAD